MSQSYIIFDAEYGWDLEGHALFQQSEGYDPYDPAPGPIRSEWIEARWVFRPPVALSWLVVTVDAEGVLSPGSFKTVGAPEHSTKELLSAFMMELRSLPQAKVVSWGGGTCDIPRLRQACMNEGVQLAPLLMPACDSGASRANFHIDLCYQLQGYGKPVHLNEQAAALRIPAKPQGLPGSVAKHIMQGKWSQVKACSEADVLVTALILGHYHHVTHGSPSKLLGSLLRIADLGRSQTHRTYAQDFEDYRNQLFGKAFDEGAAALIAA